MGADWKASASVVMSDAASNRSFSRLWAVRPQRSAVWTSAGGSARRSRELFCSEQSRSAELQDAIDKAPDPALPIADFGNSIGMWRDFIGNKLTASSGADILESFAPIWRRLHEIPYRTERSRAAELVLLRLAYSRDTPINATYAPHQQQLVEYPLIGSMPAARHRLEALASLNLLRRRHFIRLHLCGVCQSARQIVYEACKACGGAELAEDNLVHHYRCGCLQPEARFVRGDWLICPKCTRALRHLGVDYGKPGKAVICKGCDAVDSEPVVRFSCLDCATSAAAESAATVDWFHYDLTEDAVRALRMGRLPQFDMFPIFQGRIKTHTPRDFSLLATQEARVSTGLGRPFSAARVTIVNFEAVLNEIGPIEMESCANRVVDAVVAELRKCDFVGLSATGTAMIGFPGMSAKEVHDVVARVYQIVNATAISRLDLDVEIAENEAIAEMLARL